MNTVNRYEVKDLIKTSKGRFFTVIFTKKNGETREMNCRLGVKKGLTGEGMKYNPSDYNLMVVYDAQKKDYRMIKLTTVKSLVIDKKFYTVV